MGMGAAKSCIAAGLDTYGVDLNQTYLDALKAMGAKVLLQGRWILLKN